MSTAMGEAEKPGFDPSVLLVDDRLDKILALEAVLQGLGANLVKASSGKEALRHLLTRDFAVILLDINMPEMNGYETAAFIRERPRSRHTPIIFTSAVYPKPAEQIRAYVTGAVDYLVMPAEPVILRSKVSVFVELARQSRMIEQQAGELRRREEHAQSLAEARDELVKDLEQRNLELRWAREALVELAQRDSLTGLFNRRRFDEELRARLAESRRYQTAGALLALDVDGLKPINDAFGHPAGDLVLQSVAGVLRHSVREIDVPARTGGDEFSVLLSHAPLAGALIVASRILDGMSGRTVLLGHKPVAVTCSIGVAVFPDHAQTPDVLTACADRALYQAKRSGRCQLYAYAPAAVASTVDGAEDLK